MEFLLNNRKNGKYIKDDKLNYQPHTSVSLLKIFGIFMV